MEEAKSKDFKSEESHKTVEKPKAKSYSGSRYSGELSPEGKIVEGEHKSNYKDSRY